MILNEKEYVCSILKSNEPDISKIHTFLGLYARYLYYEDGLRKAAIAKKLNEFMQLYYPRYNPIDWTARIERYASKAEKYPLCECSGIRITENEQKTIEALQSKVSERLAFTLLCLAKFQNFRNPLNNNWLNYSNGEIYDMACINTTALEKDLKMNGLREAGLIEFAKKVSNLSIRVLFVDDDSETAFFVRDFRKLGYEWRLCQGENYIRCAGCGILVKNTNGKRKYCKDCAVTKKKALDRARMQELRAADQCYQEEKNETQKKSASII